MVANRIRVIALCSFLHQGKILVEEHFDDVKAAPYYRPPGGTIEFGEKAENTVRREIMEELGQEITGVKLLAVLENIFRVNGQTGHEIVYVYEARFSDAAAYKKESMMLTEDSGASFQVFWKSLDFFNDYHRLVPEALFSLLNNNKT